jgi:asparaginyl-tRNA synthetase
MPSIREIIKGGGSFIGKAVALEGWVRTVRTSKAICFIELNDGTFFRNLQLVVDESVPNFIEASKLGVGASISATGEIVAGRQAVELSVRSISIEGSSPANYPLQKKRHSFEYLREIAHLRPRTNTFSAVFRVRSLAAYAIHKHFSEQGFIWVHTPIITGSDCEGAGEMFKVTTLDMANPKKTASGEIDFNEDFFGKMANLTVSGQLNAETFASAFRNVYTFGPTFRAENSNTARHAAEFWMVEPEIAFADLADDMELAEGMLKSAIRYCLDNAQEEMEFFSKHVDSDALSRLEDLLSSSFAKISYTDAVRELEKSNRAFQYPVKWGMDLQTEHERFISEEVFQKPVFITDYPKEIKAFYMRQNDDGKTVAAMDLIAPGIGEIIGGSQREERLDALRERMEELGLDEEPYWWYLDLRRFGSVKHSGFGMGFERFIMYLTGMTNIRDVIPFPRTKNNADF